MEGVLVDIEELKELFDAKLNPIIVAIEKLETQQEKVTNLIAEQMSISKSVTRTEEGMILESARNEKVHDEVFSRLRSCEMDSGNKLWDILKLIIAAAFGGIIAVLAGRR